jgi:4-hydroxy-3-methylbut-2-enyl diphosphate reductase
MRIEVIAPHGFCGGVERAVRMAHELLDRVKGTVYGLHEIVHNESVVDGLVSKGMVFVESIAEVPEGATVLVSAHGTSPDTFEDAKRRGLTVIDATCPFVLAGHAKIRENFRNGMRTVVIGKPTHAEVKGYLGEEGACLPDEVRPGERTGRVVQTTLNADEYGGVCTATRDRQQAVRRFVESEVLKGLSPSSVGVLVVGSLKSSNTGKLADIAERAGARSWRVSGTEDVPSVDFSGIEVLGVTSGASTPEDVFDDVVGNVSQSMRKQKRSGI